MHVLLIGNFVPDRQESMLRFARQLTDGLRAIGHEVTTWAPEPRLVRLLPRYRYDGLPKYVGYLDKFVLFPRGVRRRLAREASPDVVHIVDHANAVYAQLFTGFPLLATCHDLLQIRAARGEFPERRLTVAGRRYQAWILDNIARLPHVATPSAQTARDLRRLAGLSADRVSVIPLGLNFPYRRVDRVEACATVARLLRERGHAPDLLECDSRGFLLNVGGGQWYKNRRGLLEIYAALRLRLTPAPRLLLVGKPLAPEHEELRHRLGLGEDVVHVANLSEHELQALYSAAEGLLFPSLYEGFGWPVAEAQACGCPVFTSNRPPMTEVAGDAAITFDPTDPASAAARIAAAWNDRETLRAQGLRRASEWTTGRMIERYAELYAQLDAAKQTVAA